jgi:hypothetical protein
MSRWKRNCLQVTRSVTEYSHPQNVAAETKCQALSLLPTLNMSILIVVFPCMLIITQLLFQQIALVFLLLKAQDITICAFVFVFNPRGFYF